MDYKTDVFGILLAAGGSKRLGSPKQLLEVNGKALINYILELALGSKVDDWLLVLGGNRDKITSVLHPGNYTICIAPNWEDGMGSSLSAAIRYARGIGYRPKAYLILVCDQPFLSTQHLDTLLLEWDRHNKLIASTYNGRTGAPAIIPSIYADQLIRLQGDQGARHILRRHVEIQIEFEKGALDLDTPEDYEKYLNMMN